LGGGLNEVGLPGIATRPALRLLRPARHNGQLNARHKKTVRMRRCRYCFSGDQSRHWIVDAGQREQISLRVGFCQWLKRW